MKEERYIVTGAAGFIGSALIKRLIKEGKNILGIDYFYDDEYVRLKNDRLESINIESKKYKNFWEYISCDIRDKFKVNEIFESFKPTIVINLAAKAGVRYSIENPNLYLDTNICGFNCILEASRSAEVKNFIYASSSSVYGGNTKIPFIEDYQTDHPLSIYAASKKANELIAHTYSYIYNLPVTGLRFFTVYGPWGRPDMAPFIFAKSIIERKPLKVFNYGNMMRDFTFIDDVVESIYRCCKKPASINNRFDTQYPESSSSFAPYKIFNIGNSNPINLKDFIDLLEKEIGIESIRELNPLQAGDVISTYSDSNKLNSWIGYKPSTSLNSGVKFFIKWFINYYQNNI